MKYSKSRPQSTQVTLVISMASLAFIVALFFQLFVSVKSWGDEIKSQMKVYVYLSDSLQTADLANTITYFKSRPYLGVKELKPELEFKSKAQIASEFLKSSQEDYQTLLGEENPFKNCLILGIKEEFKNEAAFKKIVAEIQARPEVYEVTYPSNVFSSIVPKIKLITSIVSVIVLILCVWIYLQLSNYVKLQIHSNRMIIKSMQLLGSTNSFIFKPYLINSLLIGLIGGLIGYTLINGLVYYTTSQIPEINYLAFDAMNQFTLISSLLLFCVLFSLISTYISLNKYTRISHVNII